MDSSTRIDRDSGIYQFNGKNYQDWKTRMAFLFKDKKLFDHVQSTSAESRADATWQEEDIACQTLVVKHVSPSILEIIKNKTCAYDMLYTIEDMYATKGLGARSVVRKKIQQLKFSEKESLVSHLQMLDVLIEEYNDCGGQLKPDEILQYMLESLPPSYMPMVAVIYSQSKVFKNYTLESAKNSLLEFESMLKAQNPSVSNSTESVAFGAKKKFNKKKKVRCYNCNEEGHKADRCPKPNKKQQQRQQANSSWAILSSQEQALISSTDSDEVIFIIDSGATEHLVTDATFLINKKNLDKPFKISIAKNDEHLNVTEAGDINVISVVNGREERLNIQNVCVANGLRHNLFSVRCVEMRGGEVAFRNGKAYVKMGQTVIAIGERIGHLYYLKFKRQQGAANLTSTESSSNLWHRRLGHLGMQNVCKLINSKMVDGIKDTVNEHIPFCEPCVMGKATRNPFNRSRPATSRPLERVHTDVSGKMQVESIDGAWYYVTFIDDFTHLTVTCVISRKSDVFHKFKQYHQMATAHFNVKLECLRCDQGGEYTSTEFKNYLAANGIRGEYNVPYNPELNGVAERANRTIVEKARSMMHDSGLPKNLWSEAVMAATYLINRSPTVVLKNKTPYEMWFNRKPNISNLRIFGCRALCHIPKELRQKLDSKCEEAIMVGYDINGYRLYDRLKKKVIVARNVTFDEKVKYSNLTINDVVNEFETLNLSNDCDQEPQPSVNVNSEAPVVPTINIQPPAPEATEESRYPARTRREPSRYGDLINWEEMSIDSLSFCGSAWSDDIPKSFAEIDQYPDAAEWRSAVSDEIKSLIDNKTWIVVERPEKAKLLNSKWVFKKKDEPNGNQRYKARLVACGYLQKAGVDYSETYSPVARLPTIRTVLAVALQKNFVLRHLDVKTAFLNGQLDEIIYMKCPDGVDIKPNHILQLKKSLYGLKQSPRCWNIRFNKFITSIGFINSLSDSCLYILHDGKNIVYVCLYVDDLLMAGSDSKLVEGIVSKLKSEFQMTDLGPPAKFMGLHVEYDMSKGWMTLDQINFAEQLLKKFNMHDSKPVLTPIETTKLTKSDVASTNQPFREVIGSIMYLVLGTRPDLAFALGYISRFQETPTDEHWVALKRILRYIQGSKDIKLCYSRNELAPPLCGFVDSDWASDVSDRKSTSGFILKVFGSTVLWSSRKQQMVTLSTTEAEYVAACCATQELIWLNKILHDMKVNLTLPIVMYEDNQGCIFLAKNSETKRSKHIDVKWHYLRNCVTEGQIKLEYIATEKQEADILTKPLPKPSFERHRSSIGLKRGGVSESVVLAHRDL